MKTLREFDHDGSHFEIQAFLTDDVVKFWRMRVLCDGNVIGEPVVVSEDNVTDAKGSGLNLLEMAADDLEQLVKTVYDLSVKRIS